MWHHIVQGLQIDHGLEESFSFFYVTPSTGSTWLSITPLPPASKELHIRGDVNPSMIFIGRDAANMTGMLLAS